MNPEPINPVVPAVKQLRRDIDGNIQTVAGFMTIHKITEDISAYQHELELVHTKLVEAKMWAGKILEAVGNPFPAELADKAETK